MSIEKLKELYVQRGQENEFKSALKSIEDLENYLSERDRSIRSCGTDDIKEYISYLVAAGDNTIERIVALARYFYLKKKNDIYIYFTTVLGGVGVIENIRERCVRTAGQETADRIFCSLPDIPLGSPLSEYPAFTKKLVDGLLSEVSDKDARKILNGNNHDLNKESFKNEHELYMQATDIDTYLKELHERKVKQLQYHSDNDIIWFEQRITQRVVDFVKGNQEVLSAVREGNKLYVTKIPYDTENYLDAPDPDTKKYYACHCQFVREAFRKSKSEKINENWCYCSAGFTKFAFDNILGKDLKIRLLNSPLKGDDICRFVMEM